MSMDRRSFLRGAAVAGVAAAGMGLAACSSDEGDEALSSTGASRESWMPEQWDHEADMVICGFGAAGSAAAIEAADNGMSVLLLEKMDEENAGGNISICAGFTNLGFRGGVNMTAEEVMAGSMYYWNEEQANEYLAYEKRFDEMMDKIGCEQAEWGGSTEPHMYCVIPNADEVGNTGWYWYELFKAAVEDRADNVTVLYETPAIDLVQNPVTGEVLGVKAGTDEAPVYCKCNKGVFIATGGFENDPELFEGTYQAGLYAPCTGHPCSTGDGLKMMLRAGAKHTHIHSAVEYMNACFKQASLDAGTAIGLGQGVGGTNLFDDGYIIVNKDGDRFCDETEAWMHDHTTPNRWYDMGGEWFGKTDSLGYKNMPCWIIFDQTELESGPLGRQRGNGGWGWNTSNPNRPCQYEWSADNMKEVENGYLIQADTIEELCAKLTDTDIGGRTCSPDPQRTAAALAAYNENAKNGTDDEFGRLATTMKPIENGPYYGAAVAMGTIYTIGGVNTEVDSNVVDWNGNRIPRLYAGGNVASPMVMRTPAVHGAVSRGIAAADAILALDPVEG